MTHYDVVGWLVWGSSKIGALRIELFLLLPPACAYTSTGKKYALIREMRLIKSAFFNAGILRTTAKYALNR